jgi:hypothetical protein
MPIFRLRHRFNEFGDASLARRRSAQPRKGLHAVRSVNDGKIRDLACRKSNIACRMRNGANRPH